VVDRDGLFLGHATERGGQMDDRIHTPDAALEHVGIPKVAEDGLCATAFQGFRFGGVTGKDADAFALAQQARDEAAADSAGGTGDESCHVVNLRAIGTGSATGIRS